MTLTICMIVKNEGPVLERCLSSVKNIADEIIVVDTGSSDDSVQIAKTFGAKIIEYKWKGDFSDARNKGLELASQPWILVIDADEVLSVKDHESLLKLLKNEDVDGYAFVQRNYTNEDAREGIVINENDKYPESRDFFGWNPSKIVRLFKNNNKIKFEGKLHEVVEPSIDRMRGKIIVTDIPIHHYKENNIKIDKHEQYIKLAKEKIMDDPKNAVAYYELGTLQRVSKDFESAELNLVKAVDLNPRFAEAFQALGVVCNNLKKYSEAVKVLRKVNTLFPKYADPYFSLGVSYMKLGNLQSSARSILKGLEIKMDLNALINLGAVFEKGGQYDKAEYFLRRSLKFKETKRGFYNLGIVLAKKKEFIEALELLKKASSLGHTQADSKIKQLEKIPK